MSRRCLRMAILAALAFGCEPAVITLPATAGGPDAASNPTPNQDAAASSGIDAGDDGGAVAANCEPAQQTLDTGHHNPGLDCITCHNGQVAGAPPYTLAGTLYTDAAGTNPVVGGTIVVHTADGQTLKIPTAQNGNFYTGITMQFPITVEASRCPDTMAMPTQVPGPTASCNSCHVAGGQANARVHLP